MNTFSLLRRHATLFSLFALLGMSHAAGAQTYVYDSTFGSFGSGNGQLSGPYTLALDSSGNLYAAEYSNNRVEEFTSGGTFVQTIGKLRQWPRAVLCSRRRCIRKHWQPLCWRFVQQPCRKVQ